MSNFKRIVFSGGGSRCLWQVGFWDSAAPALKIKPRLVAGVSAGGAMAAMVMSGTSGTGIRLIKEATAANRKNFYFTNLFRSTPSFPHYRIYRHTVVTTVDAAALERIRKGPEIRITMAHPPAYLGARSGTATGLIAYSLEKNLTHPMHPAWGKKLGYTSTVARLNDCATPDEAADLIMCSSCTPPFVPILSYKGRVALDGGIIDNVPVYAVEDDTAGGDVLVLLTRRYGEKSIPRVPGRVYVQPSSEPPVSKWDYTNPDGLQKAYDMGRRDGDVFVKSFAKK